MEFNLYVFALLCTLSCDAYDSIDLFAPEIFFDIPVVKMVFEHLRAACDQPTDKHRFRRFVPCAEAVLFTHDLHNFL